MMNESVILCVDDEDIVLKSLKRELKKTFGDRYLIETAESGQEALEFFEELSAEGHEIPIVISDQIMPGMKGSELLQRIHALAPKTLKIMLTGQADLNDVTYAVNFANLYHYVAKPWEPTNLGLILKSALTRYYQDKQLEEQNRILQNMNSVLEEQVKERTAELENANASKDKFFSIIAHDLKSPFNGLIGMTELFADNLGEFSQDDIKEGLEKLQKTAETVYNLLENLLTWSRLQRGIMEFSPQEIFLHQIAEMTSDLFTSNFIQKEISFKDSIDETLSAYGDFNMVTTIFRNLMSNALKFTESRGTIEISAIERDDEYVEIAVSDTGVGMSQDDLAKLFRIDVKYSLVGTAGERGTGLGLILCKELIEHNRGTIWVESEPGKGTTFTFTLPCPSYSPS
ncbi:hypothetical protein CSA56_15525 [candidate division KSB3 bacterium]|uniref:histidine kinase n=1 Tax=candidate division KSB3 bacterium TaxID=2044937 RepID=A0A2G6K9R9_9BACT|nr:MAG: hypothetical protein CSA56_15525 [candidate division KSB3 bacterium]